MNIRLVRSFGMGLTAAAAVAAAGPAQSAIIFGSLTTTGTVGSPGANINGQTFTTLPAQTDLNLDTVTFKKGANGFVPLGTGADGSAVFLNIYTDADGVLNSGPRQLIGASTNSVDYNAAAVGDDLVFELGGLTLLPGTKYFASFSATQATGGFVTMSVQWPVGLGSEQNYYADGAFVQNAGGTISESPGRDVFFEAVLVPEPGSLGLAAAGLALVARRRRPE